MDRWQALRDALATSAGGERRISLNSHELDYGRHAGPPAHDARRAAVLVLLVHREGVWQTPLMVRPTTVRTHAGQVSFPGGRIEPGESPETCALRESAEEVGIEADDVEVLGRLSPVYIYASNNEMLPCLAVARRVPEFKPNPAEVARVFWLPISALFEADRRGVHEIRRWGSSFYTPHVRWENEHIWGATRLVLEELAELWRRFGLGDDSDGGILTPSR